VRCISRHRLHIFTSCDTPDVCTRDSIHRNRHTDENVSAARVAARLELSLNSWPNLNTPHREDKSVEENGNIHKEVPVSDVVQIIINVLVNQEGSICTDLP
jgi:hypothetical protein